MARKPKVENGLGSSFFSLCVLTGFRANEVDSPAAARHPLSEGEA